MNIEELKPLKRCPFCGQTTNLHVEELTPANRKIRCQGCLIEMVDSVWNTRPIEEELKATIELKDDAIQGLSQEIKKLKASVFATKASTLASKPAAPASKPKRVSRLNQGKAKR